MSDPFAVNPHVWVRTRKLFPPIVEDESELRNFANNLMSKSGRSAVLPDELLDDIVSSFGGCLLLYEELFSSTKVVADELKRLKYLNISSLMLALDLMDNQTFTAQSLNRFKLLQAIAQGEKINPEWPRAFHAEYFLTKHDKREAFLGVHPEGHLFLAVPMTKQSLKEIERLVAEQEDRLAKKDSFFSWWK